MKKTYSAKPREVEAKWYLINAEGQTLGRLASLIANILRGKNKPQYTPHIDTGDFVVVINAEKIKVTGKKMKEKNYYSHSGYGGGFKTETLEHLMNRRPDEAMRKAVKNMLPNNKLRQGRMARLMVFPGADHPHAAQKPKTMKLISTKK